MREGFSFFWYMVAQSPRKPLDRGSKTLRHQNVLCYVLIYFVFVSSVHIAHTGMSTQDIGENVEKAINTIGEKIHGGWDNIKTIHLRTNSSVSLPVYTNLIRPDWDLSKTTPHELKNEDLDNCMYYLNQFD